MPKKKVGKGPETKKTEAKGSSKSLSSKPKDFETKKSGTNLKPSLQLNSGDSPQISPGVTPRSKIQSSEILPVSEVTPEPTPKSTARPFQFPNVQLTEEEKREAAQLALQKEKELQENEIRKRASAERYKQAAKEQAATLARKKFVIDSKVMNREKLKEWAHSQETEQRVLRDKIKKKNARNSDVALIIVLVVWVAIVLGIFYHVYATIQLGRTTNMKSSPSSLYSGFSSSMSQ